MLLTWTVLPGRVGASGPAWTPAGAAWVLAGHGSRGRAEPPPADGTWWSVLAAWPGEPGEPEPADGAWHVVLQPVACSGDVVLPDVARPFDALATGRTVDGAAAVVTVAGASPDDGREREFFRRFLHASRDVGSAPGNRVALVQAPAAGTGPVLTFSAWTDLAAAVDWAYTRSRPHSRAVVRQRESRLVTTSGSVRCAVLSSAGTLAGLPDPLAGLRGTAAAALAPA